MALEILVFLKKTKYVKHVNHIRTFLRLKRSFWSVLPGLRVKSTGSEMDHLEVMSIPFHTLSKKVSFSMIQFPHLYSGVTHYYSGVTHYLPTW